MALGEPMPEEVEDYLLPDVEGMEKIKGIVLRFRDLCYGEDYVDPTETANNAKAAAGGGDAEGDDAKTGKRKKKNAEEDEEDAKGSKKEPKGSKKNGKEKESANEKGSGNPMDAETNEADLDRIEKLLSEGKGDGLKVGELKDYLTSKGLDTKGKKSELIERALKKIKKD